MGKLLKWVGIALAGVVGIILLIALAGYIASERRMNRIYDIAVQPLTVPADASSLEEGQRLTVIRGCIDCHGADYGGMVLVEDPLIGNIYAPNLTTGAGSATAGFAAEDWARVIRHGVDPNGRSILFMPSTDYSVLSDEDVSRIVAYLRSASPVDRSFPASNVGPLARVMLLANQLPLLPAEEIDHSVVAPRSVAAEPSVAFGAYLAATCTGCHRANFAGGPTPFAEPGTPPAANLTPAGHLAGWSLDGFKDTLRTGVTPEGKQLDPSQMPWPLTSAMTDVELEAMWLYLNSLPPAAPAQ